jgi:hypothetical protein
MKVVISGIFTTLKLAAVGGGMKKKEGVVGFLPP